MNNYPLYRIKEIDGLYYIQVLVFHFGEWVYMYRNSCGDSVVSHTVPDSRDGFVTWSKAQKQIEILTTKLD